MTMHVADPIANLARGAVAQVKAQRVIAGVAPKYLTYTANPEGYITDVLREFAWSKQRAILASVRDHRRTAVKSCHDVGKSFIAARAVAHWLGTHRPGEAFVVTSAPTAHQVTNILWREIGHAYASGRLPGRLNLTEWYMHGMETYTARRPGEEIVAIGRKPADTNPTAFQGIHARYVLVVLDEACGIPKALYDATEALVTNEGSRILAIGNPDDPASHFATVCKPGSGWNVITISAFDSPNFTDEEVPESLRSLLISPKWVEEQAKSWGVDSALYTSKILGEFPEDTEDGIVPWSWTRRCVGDRVYSLEDLTPIELGVDVGGGSDLTVVRERCGVMVGRTWRARTKESSEAVGLVRLAIRESGATAAKIDVIGIGWGVAGALRDSFRAGEHKCRIVGVNASASPRDVKKFAKTRDEMWWNARELTMEGRWDLSGCDDDTLAQLIAPKWSINSSGQVKVEAKEETIKRIGHSPDDADALNLAFYTPAGNGWAEFAREELANRGKE